MNFAPAILVVDASGPSNIAVTTLAMPAVVGGMSASGDLLYTTSSFGVGIYRISAITGAQVTASVEVPNNTGVAVVPGSFNIPPTQIIDGTSFQTLVWTFPLSAETESQQITWQSTVSNMQPDEVRPVTLETTVNATIPGGADNLTLQPLDVVSVPPDQTLNIPVNVVVPGTQALSNAADAANQIGKTDLANRFNDLSIALGNLVQNPTNAVHLSQSQTAITSIISQLTSDAFLAAYIPSLAAASAAGWDRHHGQRG